MTSNQYIKQFWPFSISVSHQSNARAKKKKKHWQTLKLNRLETLDAMKEWTTEREKTHKCKWKHTNCTKWGNRISRLSHQIAAVAVVVWFDINSISDGNSYAVNHKAIHTRPNKQLKRRLTLTTIYMTMPLSVPLEIQQYILFPASIISAWFALGCFYIYGFCFYFEILNWYPFKNALKSISLCAL